MQQDPEFDRDLDYAVAVLVRIRLDAGDDEAVNSVILESFSLLQRWHQICNQKGVIVLTPSQIDIMNRLICNAPLLITYNSTISTSAQRFNWFSQFVLVLWKMLRELIHPGNEMQEMVDSIKKLMVIINNSRFLMNLSNELKFIFEDSAVKYITTHPDTEATMNWLYQRSEAFAR